MESIASEVEVKKPSKHDIILEELLFSSTVIKQLTKRECEILKLIVTGHTNKEIATILHRTERTIEYHRYRLMRKIGVRRSADLIKLSIEIGLV